MSKPVQVFILMGQSNMLGFGDTAALADVVRNHGRFTHLMDEQGNWTTRRDVRNVRVMFANGSMSTFNNEWLTVSGKNFGPEIGFGHIMGHVLDAPVLILKSCIGNRALGWDLLPPGSESYEYEGKTIPGYEGSRDPSRRPKGRWYAGKQYDDDTDCVREVLSELGRYYPGARGYEIAGFVWWQGHKDQQAEWAVRYERNLVQLIKALREDFDAPDAPFVCATIGFGGRNMGGHALTVAEAQLAVADPRRYPEFAGNVRTVDTRPFWRGGGAHYGGNPETYMEVGIGLGWAMAELLESRAPGGAVRRIVAEDDLDGPLRRVFGALVDDRLAQAETGLRPYLADDATVDPEQVRLARKLAGYLDSLVSGALAELRQLEQGGDLCALRNALQASDDRFRGVTAYDAARAKWTALLDTDDAARELAAGSELQSIVDRRDRLELASYYRLIEGFRSDNPDSFYARRAAEELRAIDALVRETIAEIEALGAKGDVYAKYERIEEAKDRLARIPAFDEAATRWSQEFREKATRDEYYAGKTYAEIFDDLETLDERYREIVQKNGEITAPRAREQAAERATEYYVRKLRPIATRLEKLAESNGDSYYGKAARTAYDGYLQSGGTALQNPLAGDGK
ncbi:MAG: hypothetical protein IPM29_26900 [Planctomycetes bacterium]|nr:hypothetical protein [Planctomycetota bacterium]